ncbi:MAG: RNA methyltransferase [Pleurocapsa sp. MO_192.B19]|nr:RNA methyltransferase [Pleurocapsa sp. MO_192.B19]
MENIILTSIKNPLIKQVRKLHRAQERHKQNLLLLEGTNLIEAACQVDYKLDIVFHTDRWQENHQPLCLKLANKDLRMQLVSSEVLNAIATTVNPDGVVAIAPRRLDRELVVAQTKLRIAIEKLQDPGNLGTIIRTAVATGVDGLWLSPDSVDINSPKVLRASVGAWFRLPIATDRDLSQLVQQHQQQGIRVIATTSQATKSYWKIDFTHPCLILLGNEGAGLSEELIAMADEQVKIPLANGVESLNVAVATALLLYEAQRQFFQA